MINLGIHFNYITIVLKEEVIEFYFHSFIFFRVNLTTLDQLTAVTKTIENSMQKVVLANLTLGNLKTKTSVLKETAQNLKQNSTKLQERNVEGN